MLYLCVNRVADSGTLIATLDFSAERHFLPHTRTAVLSEPSFTRCFPQMVLIEFTLIRSQLASPLHELGLVIRSSIS